MLATLASRVTLDSWGTRLALGSLRKWGDVAGSLYHGGSHQLGPQGCGGWRPNIGSGERVFLKLPAHIPERSREHGLGADSEEPLPPPII